MGIMSRPTADGPLLANRIITSEPIECLPFAVSADAWPSCAGILELVHLVSLIALRWDGLLNWLLLRPNFISTLSARKLFHHSIWLRWCWRLFAFSGRFFFLRQFTFDLIVVNTHHFHRVILARLRFG